MRTRASRPGVAAAAFLAVAVIGVVSVALAARPPAIAPGVGSSWAIALGLAAGMCLAAAGALEMVVHAGSRLGPMLVLAAVAWFVAVWASPGTGSDAMFTAGLVLGSAWPAVLAHAVVDDVRAAGGRVRGALVASGYLCCLGLLGLVPAILGLPDASCPSCPANLVRLPTAGMDTEWVVVAGLFATAAWSAVVVACCLSRTLRASAAERPLVVAVTAPAAGAIAAFGVATARDAIAGGVRLDDLAVRLWAGSAVLLVLLAAGVGWRVLRRRQARQAVGAIVLELGGGAGAGVVQARLRELLDDPGLVVAYPDPDGGLVDASGARVDAEPGPGRVATPVADEGRTVAILVHRASLTYDPDRLSAVAVAAALALEHEGLTAVSRARLAELQASRVRLVEANDRERRRLEHDLHDGAQQRLAALAVGLGLAAGRSDDPAPLRAAEREVRAAIAELRELAHGIYPAMLEDLGLDAAIADLADGAAVPVRVEGRAEGRLPRAVELTGYVAIAGALAAAGPDGIRVRTTVRDGRLRLRIAIPAPAVRPGEPPAGVEDRVLALGGTISIESDGSRGTIVHVEIPCES